MPLTPRKGINGPQAYSLEFRYNLSTFTASLFLNVTSVRFLQTGSQSGIGINAQIVGPHHSRCDSVVIFPSIGCDISFHLLVYGLNNLLGAIKAMSSKSSSKN